MVKGKISRDIVLRAGKGKLGIAGRFAWGLSNTFVPV
jgi:hypothetical protein